MSIAELRKLPVDEKLKIIEALWSDIAADDEAFASPVGHEAELRKTEAEFAAGKIDVLDWEEAKKQLRSSSNESEGPASGTRGPRCGSPILRQETSSTWQLFLR